MLTFWRNTEVHSRACPGNDITSLADIVLERKPNRASIPAARIGGERGAEVTA